MKSVTIVGAGAVGSSIALALFYSKVTIAGIYSENGLSARILAKKIKCANFGTLQDATIQSDVVIIAVPDNQILNAAVMISNRIATLHNKTVFHTSGALGSDELRVLKKKGAAVGSIHPLQTFSGSKKQTSLKHIWCAVEGDKKAFAVAKLIIKKLQMNLFTISKRDKSLYHASAVFASNYLVTLLSVVERISLLIHIPKEKVWKIYLPLIQQTIQNVKDFSPSEALTGPIVRRDAETISKHIQVLSNPKLKNLAELYSVLGLETIRLVKRKNAR